MWEDLRYAWRTLARAPGLAALIIVTLGLSIGASTAIFSVVDYALLSPLPYPDADELVAVYGSRTDEAGSGSAVFNGFLPVSWPTIRDLRAQSSRLEGVYAYGIWPVSLSSQGTDPERVSANVVTANYFEVLGLNPTIGRFFGPDEEADRGFVPAAVLSHAFWRSRFSEDPSVVGRSIVVNAVSYTVIGVGPAGFSGTSRTLPSDIWLPLGAFGQVEPRFGPLVENRAARMFFAGARMQRGVTLADASAELSDLGGSLAERFPDLNTGRSLQAIPLASATVNPGRRSGYVRSALLLLGSVSLILLISCLNVANLLFARSLGRGGEMAVRTAIGATTGRLTRQLFMESLVLFSIAGVVGLLLAFVIRDGLVALQPPLVVPSAQAFDPPLSLRAGVFAMTVTALAGLAFGLWPALSATRSAIAHELKREIGGGRGHARTAMVVGQVALSVVALLGAGLLIRSFDQARRIDPGWQPEGLATLAFDPAVGGRGPDELREFYSEVLRRTLTVPGVRSAGVAQLAPLTVGPLHTVQSDAPSGTSDLGTPVRANSVSADYFATMGIDLVAGRVPDSRDRVESQPVVIVNAELADRFWSGVDPIGRALLMGEETFEVIGVVETGKYVAVGEPPQPAAYFVLEQLPPESATLFVRFENPSTAALDLVRREVQDVDRNLPVYNVGMANRLLADALWSARIGAILLGVFGVSALLLAALGVYGVMSTVVRERSPEMGVRMALGASGGRVVGHVLWRAQVMIGLGVGFGVLVGLAGTRVVSGLLYDVSPWDPWTFLLAPAGLALVGVLAALIPAMRAAHVSPVETLRRG